MVTTFEEMVAARLAEKERNIEKVMKGKPGSVLSGKQIQVQPYECGFCNAGFHYQSKRAKGPVCKFIYNLGRNGIVTCLCDCTKTERAFREMAKAMGKEIPTDSESEFVLPAPSARTAVDVASSPPADALPPDESPAPDTGTAPMQFSFGETGRVEKGQLEQAVWQVCIDALDKKIPVPGDQITPQFIAFEITLRTGTEYRPSPGAVSAVLERWAKIVWCEMETGPARLVGMSDDLREKGPLKMKSDIAGALRRVLRRF